LLQPQIALEQHEATIRDQSQALAALKAGAQEQQSDMAAALRLVAESHTARARAAASAAAAVVTTNTTATAAAVSTSYDRSTGGRLHPGLAGTSTVGGAPYSLNNTGAPLSGVHPGNSRSTAAFSSSSLGLGSASVAIPALPASAPGRSVTAGSINPTAAAAAAAARHLLRSELPPVLEEEPHVVLYPPAASTQTLLMQGVCVWGGTYGSEVHLLVSLLAVEPDQETGRLWGGSGWLMHCTSPQVTSCTACLWLRCASNQRA
jgi:hypothetical protein